MEIQQILKLIDHVSDSRLTSFSMEGEGVKLSMECGQAKAAAQERGGQTEAAILDGTPSLEREEKKEILQGKIVKSPLVGTFYAAPSQEADPFVQVGDFVKKGQIMAIVEAMKLMNEIESDFDGEVAEIYVENGQPVEYGTPLFRIQ